MIDPAYIKAGTVEGDTISRQAAVEVLHFWEKNYIWDEDCLNEDAKDIVVSPSKMIEKLPSAQPIQTASNYLQSLPTSPLLVGKMPPAQPDRSLWFRIGEVCVGESKGDISAEMAVEKIRELLREAERREG